MIRLRCAHLGLILTAALSSLTKAQDEATPVSIDPKRLIGTWEVMAAEERGQRIEEMMLLDQALIFEADGSYRVLVGQTAIESGQFTVDAASNLGWIDLRITRGKDAGKVQRGLFRFEGNRLLLTFYRPGVESRPKDFDTRPETEQFTFWLRRRLPK